MGSLHIRPWALVLGLIGFPAIAQVPAHDLYVYFGTYTGFQYTVRGVPTGHSMSQGIYVSRFSPATGEISEPQLAAEIRNPSFLVVHPDHRFLYSVSEDPQSVGPYRDKGSFVSAFAIEPSTGKLRLLNTLPSSGTSTCYISVDKSGKYVLAASFGSGNVAVFPVKSDGSLGPRVGFDQHTGKGKDPHYQAGPHAHSFDVSPDGRFAVSSDLGTDRVYVYRFDEGSGTITPSQPPFVSIRPPGGGPRHFVFAPGGQFAYLISEMSGIVTTFARDPARGILSDIQETSTFPKDFNLDKYAALNSAHSAEIAVHPNGRFLYLSNRGPDTILVFAVDSSTGKLRPVEEVSSRGLMPRSFALDPSGSYLFAANEVTDGVVIFRVDPDTGRISPTRQVLRVGTPVCVQFAPAN
jgi:6-phosphogluconolactonase